MGFDGYSMHSGIKGSTQGQQGQGEVEGDPLVSWDYSPPPPLSIIWVTQTKVSGVGGIAGDGDLSEKDDDDDDNNYYAMMMIVKEW